ncbi:Protein Shroom2 [Liparis tanakae]|uniref:Protein Shroom2 n=1 Tax=Liparis tanakae TaxID=230148 RepID=A0A4Z2J3X5_9TELE|nr:Protein Shroom2 [Liparis tanakae]
MPSDTEVHVARSFLTKMLRSSMRKSDPDSRPHSWHSSKLTEEEAEPARRDGALAPIWQPKHEARPNEPREPPRPAERELRPVSSGGAVEEPRRPARLRLSEPLRGPGGKRDSGFSCFSVASSPPVHDRRASDGTGGSTQNMFFKGLPGGEGPRQAERRRHREERPAARPGAGPVWQVPEKKKSPSPPPPPLRSDSFAKVFPFSDGPGAPAPSRGPAGGRQTGGQLRPQQEARRGLDLLLPNTADHTHNQPPPDRLFSLSSNDVRLSARGAAPAHQRQRSADGPSGTGSAPPAKIQSVGSYYRSLQELPASILGRKHARHATACVAGSANPEQESGGRGPAGERSVQARLGGAETPPPGFPISSRTQDCLPPSQLPRGGPAHPAPGAHHDRRAPDRGGGAQRADARRLVASLQRGVAPSWHQDPWVPQEDRRISPLRTPLLHSLAQERRSLAATQDGKSHRRGDRYATGLRGEIREKRAQLQKSRSAATLTCTAEEEEEEEGWRYTSTSVSSGAAFSNTYKDHLKEAQARVLQATSFQRRDLEPAVGPSGGRVRGRRRRPAAQRTHSFSEPDEMHRVGVEGGAHAGSSGGRRKFLEAKPAFSRPLLKSGLGEKVKPKKEEEEEEQLRLGTFGEYQATWNRQQKSPEATERGRSHSAENILDAAGEEEAAVHERSRSSPSADLHPQVSPEESGTGRGTLNLMIFRVSLSSRVPPAEASSTLEDTSQPAGRRQVR